jgi:hypothetical protein
MVTGLKAKIIGQIIKLLTVHAYVENEEMYPEVRALLPELEDDVLESYEEHHVADVLCMELSRMVIGQVAGSELEEAYRASWRGIIPTLWRARPQ